MMHPPSARGVPSIPQAARRVRRQPWRHTSALLYWLCVGVLLLVIIGYNSAFVQPAVDQYSPDSTFSHVANIHDHLEYESRLTDFGGFSDPISTYLDNVAGISIAYFFLTALLGFQDVVTTSILVNCTALVISAAIHLKICNSYARRGTAYTFFLNLPFIYFCQLIGKDMLYVAVLYTMLLLLLQRRWLPLALLAVVAAVVRTQTIIVFLFMLILAFRGLPLKQRFLLLYVLSSFAGAYSFTGDRVIGLDADLGSGVSWIVFELNSATRLGNLLLNPVRVLQYVVEFITAPLALIGTQVHFFTLFLLPYLLYFATHLGRLRDAMTATRTHTTQFFFVTVLVMLIVPIINLRYFVALLPFAVIAMLLAPGVVRRRASPRPAIAPPPPHVQQESA